LKTVKSEKEFYEYTMPNMRVKGKKVYVKPIYWAVFVSTKIIIIILAIIFVLKEFTDVLNGFWIF